MPRSVVWIGLGLCLVFGAIGTFRSGIGTAAAIPPDFSATWERTDRPVAEGQATRTWIWGPQGHTGAFFEPYVDAPGGQRLVQYFDKTRMEINDPDGDPTDPWHVTNGLLARELITGEMQAGDESFEQRLPAQVHIAGDAHPDSPTYATFNTILDDPPLPHDSVITQTIDRNGVVGEDSSLATHQVTASHYVEPTDHTIASVFWEFMNSTGTVYVDGHLQQNRLFENPFFGVGLPITEAYWMHVPVGGDWRDVLAQCFERRCLTYTPGNPDGWRVEAGNIGQHYYTWRYEDNSDDLAPPDDDALGPPVPGECEAGSQSIFNQVSDDLGNVNPNSWAQGTGGDWPGGVDASPVVNVGQEVTLTASASGDCEPLEYRFQRYRPGQSVEIVRDWSENPGLGYTFETADTGEYLMFIVDVRNQDPRTHFDGRDDYTYLTYVVE